MLAILFVMYPLNHGTWPTQGIPDGYVRRFGIKFLQYRVIYFWSTKSGVQFFSCQRYDLSSNLHLIPLSFRELVYIKFSYSVQVASTQVLKYKIKFQLSDSSKNTRVISCQTLFVNDLHWLVVMHFIVFVPLNTLLFNLFETKGTMSHLKSG